MSEHVRPRRPGANCPRSHSYRSRAISGAIRCTCQGCAWDHRSAAWTPRASLRTARNMKHPRWRREQGVKPRRTNARCTGHRTLLTAWRATTRRALDPTAHHNQIESTLATACSRTKVTRGLDGTRRMNRVTVSCRPNWVIVVLSYLSRTAISDSARRANMSTHSTSRASERDHPGKTCYRDG